MMMVACGHNKLKSPFHYCIRLALSWAHPTTGSRTHLQRLQAGPSLPAPHTHSYLQRLQAGPLGSALPSSSPPTSHSHTLIPAAPAGWPPWRRT